MFLFFKITLNAFKYWIKSRIKIDDGCHTVRVQSHKYVDYIGVDHLPFNENCAFILVFVWLLITDYFILYFGKLKISFKTKQTHAKISTQVVLYVVIQLDFYWRWLWNSCSKSLTGFNQASTKQCCLLFCFLSRWGILCCFCVGLFVMRFVS